jgi:membrane protease YdiL (CAAX protease family)
VDRSALIHSRAQPTIDRRVSDWLVIGALAAPLALGCFAVYLYFLYGSETVVGVGLSAMVVGLLSCGAVVLLSDQEKMRVVAAALALVTTLSLFVVMLPSSTNIYVDSALILSVAASASLLFLRKVDLPYIGPVRVGHSTLLMVILLPILLAIAQAGFLGLRFWESFQVGRLTIVFVPMIAAWGFTEEALFRGILLRSSVPLLNETAAVVLSSFVAAAFMLFWGSLPYAIFSFLLSLLMGFLYLRTRSLMFVGTMHALTDTWMVIAFLMFGSSLI